MTSRSHRVLLTRTALDQVERIAAWWARERPLSPDLFARELEACVAGLAQPPRIGAPYLLDSVPGLRRTLLRRCGYHVYFSVDDARGEVVIHAVWHSARGTGPDLA